MLGRNRLEPSRIIAASMLAGGAPAAENAQYPEWKGAWERFVPETSVLSPSGLRTSGGQPSFDQTKPWGPGQEAPLTPEYQKVLDDSLADQAIGGQGNNFDRAARCLPNGMPLMMTAFLPLEFVVTPETTYILTTDYVYFRRIFTDGRDWPNNIQPTFTGYSIGRWIDQDGDGIYDVLEVETRGFTGPRVFDATGLPLHSDNQSIFKERLYRERGNREHPARRDHRDRPCIDAALDRGQEIRAQPQSASELDHRQLRREQHDRPVGREAYAISADGLLMPIKKDQPSPDLRYFKQAPKPPQP